MDRVCGYFNFFWHILAKAHKDKPWCPDLMGLKGRGNPTRDITQSSKLDSGTAIPKPWKVEHMAHPVGPKGCVSFWDTSGKLPKSFQAITYILFAT